MCTEQLPSGLCAHGTQWEETTAWIFHLRQQNALSALTLLSDKAAWQALLIYRAFHDLLPVDQPTGFRVCDVLGLISCCYFSSNLLPYHVDVH